MKVLLIEDDASLGDGLSVGLQQAGYAVDWLREGHSVQQALQDFEYDALILDLGLPGMDGLDILKWLRSEAMDVPVLILTARDALEDRVVGLDSGADDYMVKPFDLDELVARIRALIRRRSGSANPVIAWGALSVEPAGQRVMFRGEQVTLTAREFALLHLLILGAGRVMTRTKLMEQTSAWGKEVESNAIEVHIHNLRKKMDSDLIKTIRGVGYMLDKLD